MQDPAHYRTEARKFVEQAQSAKSAAHRSLLLKEAQIMIRMAEQANLLKYIIQEQEGG